ncbi:MAG: HAMP domain-containing histidine kinase [Nitrospirae bacterium]|nr:HAMP domain-containing histidine kinase [Nitrospirota bacterium]
MNVNLTSLVQQETAKRQMQEQLLIQQSKMAAVGEMIAVIAHQWKQPLNAVSIVVQDLKEAYRYGELDEKYIAHTVDVTMGQITFMAKTIDDFRNFFRPSRQKAHFDVKTTIDELISMFSHIFSKNTIDVNLKVEHDLEPITDGYPNEFKQVILNILNNAKDAIISRRKTDVELHGQIEVELTNQECPGADQTNQECPGAVKNDETNNKIVIVIRDNGGGIPADVIDRIFEAYYTTKGPEGTGIGLYMSKTIIEANMGGSLTVRNIEGGAEFVITMKKSDDVFV